MARMFQRQDETFTYLVYGLFLFLIIYIVVSFLGVNTFERPIIGDKEVRVGETEEYFIQLISENPGHIDRVGKWWVQDPTGKKIITGQETKVDKTYSLIASIQIPSGYPKLRFFAEITEGKISKAKEFIDITILSCSTHADCNLENTCLGQFGYCNEKVCEVRGVCNQCKSSSECSLMDEAIETESYQCTDSQCVLSSPPKIADQITDFFKEPITEPGKVVDGTKPQPKPVAEFMPGLVLILGIFVAYLIYKKRGRR